MEKRQEEFDQDLSSVQKKQDSSESLRTTLVEKQRGGGPKYQPPSDDSAPNEATAASRNTPVILRNYPIAGGAFSHVGMGNFLSFVFDGEPITGPAEHVARTLIRPIGTPTQWQYISS